MQLQSIQKVEAEGSVIYVGDQKTNWQRLPFSKKEAEYIEQQIAQKNHFIPFNDCGCLRLAIHTDTETIDFKLAEGVRRLGAKATTVINQLKVESVTVVNESTYPEAALAFAEGLLLNNYQFLKYRKEVEFFDRRTVE